MKPINEFKAKVTTVGRSAGVIIPQWVLEACNIKKGNVLKFDLSNISIIEYNRLYFGGLN